MVQRTFVRVLTAAAVVAAFGCTGCGARGDGAPPKTAASEPPVRTTTISSYPALHAPEDAARRAPIVVLGTVEKVGPARWNTPDGSEPAEGSRETSFVPFVYTPVTVHVDKTYKGVPQGTLTLKVLGGQVGDERFTACDTWMPEEGARLVLFVDRTYKERSGATLAVALSTYQVDGDEAVPRENTDNRKLKLRDLESIVAKAKSE